MSSEEIAFTELAEPAEMSSAAETANGTHPGATDGEMAHVVSDSATDE